jgi:hypothetical protein
MTHTKPFDKCPICGGELKEKEGYNDIKKNLGVR